MNKIKEELTENNMVTLLRKFPFISMASIFGSFVPGISINEHKQLVAAMKIKADDFVCMGVGYLINVMTHNKWVLRNPAMEDYCVHIQLERSIEYFTTHAAGLQYPNYMERTATPNTRRRR